MKRNHEREKGMIRIRDSELMRSIRENLRSIGRKVEIDEASDVTVLDGYSKERVMALIGRTRPTKAHEVVIHDGDSSVVVMMGGPANSWLIPVGLSRHDKLETAMERSVSGITRWNSKRQRDVAMQVDEALLDNAPLRRVGT